MPRKKKVDAVENTIEEVKEINDVGSLTVTKSKAKKTTAKKEKISNTDGVVASIKKATNKKTTSKQTTNKKAAEKKPAKKVAKLKIENITDEISKPTKKTSSKAVKKVEKDLEDSSNNGVAKKTTSKKDSSTTTTISSSSSEEKKKTSKTRSSSTPKVTKEKKATTTKVAKAKNTEAPKSAKSKNDESTKTSAKVVKTSQATESTKDNTSTKASKTKSIDKTTKKDATVKKSKTAKTTRSTTKSKVTSATKKATSKVTSSRSTKSSTKSQVSPVIDVIEYYDLPYRYNQTIVKVLYQTPNILFIYWDISDADRENYLKQYGNDFFNNTKPVLIIHNTTLNYSFEVEIDDFANSWYLHINDTNCEYSVELGRRPKYIDYQKQIEIPNDYLFVTYSNKIESPNDHILFDKNLTTVYFKDVKTNITTSQDITSLSFIRNIGKLYHLFDLKIDDNKMNLEKFMYLDLLNPSSSNPTSTFK